MKRLLDGKLKTVAALATAGLVTVATMGTALADGLAKDGEGKHGLFGNVAAKAESSFTVETRQGNSVELAVDESTRFRTGGRGKADFDSLPLGSRVAILAEGEGETMTALKVMLVPEKPQREHRVLTVVEVSGNIIVAEDKAGNRIEVELDHELEGELQGQLITFIGVRSQQSNRFKANAEVKIGQVVRRLEAQLGHLKAEVRAEVDSEVKVEKERDAARLRARLEANMQRHLDLFTEVIAKAPVEAKASLEGALEMTLTGYETALWALGDSEAHVEAVVRLRTLHGSVEAMAEGGDQVTVNTRTGAQLDLQVNEDTQVYINGEVGTLGDVRVGDQVTVRYNSNTSVATQIRVDTEAEVSGTIQSVDAETGALVVELNGGATVELQVTSQTEIEIDGEEATVADLQANAQVKVEYDTRTMETMEIKARTWARIEGTITTVDHLIGQVTILLDSGQEVTLSVSNSTTVNIQGLLFGVLGLDAGMEVRATYNLSTNEAVELRAEGEHDAEASADATGVVSSVEQSTGSITVELDGGATLTLQTNAETEIEVNGDDAVLADVEAGSRVQVEYNARTMVASEIEARSTAESSAGASSSGSVSVGVGSGADDEGDDAEGSDESGSGSSDASGGPADDTEGEDDGSADSDDGTTVEGDAEVDVEVGVGGS